MSASSRKKVAVIIVTYNAMKYLEDCFGGLERIERGGLDLDVIVIDNASKDGTAGRIRKDYPWVTLIESATNTGFAGGNNIGMRRAIDDGAEYVYLLNHDTEPTPGFLVETVKVAEADERIGSAQSLLLLSPAKDLINSTGNAIHFLGFGYCRDYRRPVAKWRHAGIPEIAYASGAGVLYRVSALKEVGLFDEELFMYHEDLDLGWRLRLAGFSNVLAPHSVVYHKYEFSRSITKYFYMERGRYLVHCKNLRFWTLFLLFPWLLLSELALFALAVRGGWWREKLKVYAYFLRPRSWLHIWRERSRVSRLRKVGDREIVRLFSSTIGYQEVSSAFTKYISNPLMTVLWSVLRLLIV